MSKNRETEGGSIDVATETRYREPPLEKDGLTIVISQSGETADTLASLRYAKAQGQHTLAVVNVPTSTRSWRRSSTRCRCNCSPTTPPWCSGKTSTAEEPREVRHGGVKT